MGTGMRLLKMVMREVARAEKAALREQIRLEKEQIRLAKQHERNLLKAQKLKVKQAKEKLKYDLDTEKTAYENRVKQRATIVIKFLKKI